MLINFFVSDAALIGVNTSGSYDCSTLFFAFGDSPKPIDPFGKEVHAG